MDAQKALQSQFLAALKMLKEAIAKCPPELWDAAQDKDKYWFRAHHVLYWAQVDLRAVAKGFRPWKGRRKPVDGTISSKPELIQYVEHLEREISDARGFRTEKLERMIASIRHIQQHTGELYERLGSRSAARLRWYEHVRRSSR